MRDSTFGFVCKEIGDLAFGSIGSNDSETLVVHVENEILALMVGVGDKDVVRYSDGRRTMTARPMRPMSPLPRKKVSGDEDEERRVHTEEQTWLLLMR